MMSATVLGLATFATNAVSVHADDTSAATTATDGKMANNDAKLTITPGTLSLTKPGDVTFDTASVEDVYNANYSSKTSGTPTKVSDFLGGNGTWTLNASSAGFTTKTGDATALNADGASQLSINKVDVPNDGSAVKITSGKATDAPTDTDLSYGLTINAGTLLSATDYTNTITWNLANTPGTNVDSNVTSASAE